MQADKTESANITAIEQVTTEPMEIDPGIFDLIESACPSGGAAHLMGLPCLNNYSVKQAPPRAKIIPGDLTRIVVFP